MLVLDGDGTRLITETELARVEAARGVPVIATAVLARGGPDDQLSVAAAAILGVRTPTCAASRFGASPSSTQSSNWHR